MHHVPHCECNLHFKEHEQCCEYHNYSHRHNKYYNHCYYNHDNHFYNHYYIHYYYYNHYQHNYNYYNNDHHVYIHYYYYNHYHHNYNYYNHDHHHHDEKTGTGKDVPRRSGLLHILRGWLRGVLLRWSEKTMHLDPGQATPRVHQWWQPVRHPCRVPVLVRAARLSVAGVQRCSDICSLP
ncbi:uncharacterized protein LOC144124237 [Amblyomma americanum]